MNTYQFPLKHILFQVQVTDSRVELLSLLWRSLFSPRSSSFSLDCCTLYPRSWSFYSWGWSLAPFCCPGTLLMTWSQSWTKTSQTFWSTASGPDMIIVDILPFVGRLFSAEKSCYNSLDCYKSHSPTFHDQMDLRKAYADVFVCKLWREHLDFLEVEYLCAFYSLGHFPHTCSWPDFLPCFFLRLFPEQLTELLYFSWKPVAPCLEEGGEGKLNCWNATRHMIFKRKKNFHRRWRSPAFHN